MTHVDSPGLLRVVGLVRGREIDRHADVQLDDATLVFAWEKEKAWRVPLDRLDGIALNDARMSIYTSVGDVLEVSGDDRLRVLAAHLVARACTMPELTRGLRSFGSLRGSPGAAHDMWFGPLLSARRAVEGVTDALRQVTLVDAGQLGDAMTNGMAQLAALKSPGDAATQRAIEAVLEEESAALFVALGRLALAADTLTGSALDSRLADWRCWVEALREVFVAADEAWLQCSKEL